MIGQIFHKRYEILEKLGQGGTSIVYKAKDVLLNRMVTIKILQDQFANDEEFVRRFRHEAQAVAALSHPNIVSIYDVVFKEDMHYLVMEYINGRSLKEYIREKGSLTLDEVLRIEIQILDALQHAHEHNVIHRDIKPHNIMIDTNGQVKVADFGIAVAMGDITHNYTGSIVGSVHYISPEQVTGESLSERSDIYSAGVVLYELLTGEQAFQGDSAVSIAMLHVNGELVPPHKKNPDIPVELSFIVMRALRKNPELRYPSAKDMADSLRQIRAGLAKAGTEIIKESESVADYHDAKHRIRSLKSKWNPMVIITLVVVLLAIAAALMGYRLVNEFTKENEVDVPNLVGMTLEDATAKLEGIGLNITSERRYDEDVPANYIISQDTAAEQTVKKERVIGVVVSNGPQQMNVPNVVGMTRREAEVLLTNRMLKASVEEVLSDQVAPGEVIRQNPEEGEKVPKNTTVYLEVSKGQEVPMPNLVGLTLDQAKAKLAENKLTIGNTNRKESTDYVSDIVIDQSTAEGTKIMEGSSVDLTVSDGPGPLPQKARVTYGLPQTGTEHTVRIVVVDTKGTHEEYNAVHSGGDMIVQEVPFYGKGKVQIYLDDELVYSQDVE